MLLQVTLTVSEAKRTIGALGAEGSTTMVVEGEKEARKVIFDHVREIKRPDSEQGRETLAECEPWCEGCAEDPACIYSKATATILGGDPDV